MCVNKPKSGYGDTSCSVDQQGSGCEYFMAGVCMFVRMFRRVSIISLASTMASRLIWSDPVADGFKFLLISATHI